VFALLHVALKDALEKSRSDSGGKSQVTLFWNSTSLSIRRLRFLYYILCLYRLRY
jgi:hypothetical protein